MADLLIDLSRGDIPPGLTNAAVHKVDFGAYPDGVRCDRCGDDLNRHWWQLAAGIAEQGGIADCGRVS